MKFRFKYSLAAVVFVLGLGTLFFSGVWKVAKADTPVSGYASATVANPSADLTNFSLLINLASMPSSWWSLIDTTDPTKGRVTKSDGTELATDWLSFDATGKTGYVRVKWSGTLASTTSQVIRIYPPLSSSASYSATSTYGEYNAYDSYWAGYWPDGGVTDRTSHGNNGTAAVDITPGGATGVAGAATLYTNTSNSYVSLPTNSSLNITGNISILAFAKPTTISSSYGVIFGGWSPSGSFPGYGLADTNNNTFSSWNGSSFAATPNNAWTTGSWYQIGYTNNNTKDTYYVNGASIASSTGTGRTNPASYSGGRIIGAANNTSSPALQYDGYLQHLEIHSTNRSTAWIAEEYSQISNTTSFWGTWTWQPFANIPSAPTSVAAATSTPNQATITFTPGSNGGASILYYLASSTPGNITATSTGSPITVTGLTNGTSYSFAVYAVNAIGPSSNSASSNSVTPIPDFQATYVSTDGNGVKDYNVTSVANGPGTVSLRVLQPTSPAAGVAHSFLWCLPVEQDGDNDYGDCLETVRGLDAQDQYNLTVIAPSFTLPPWYADSDSNLAYRYETFMTQQLRPWVLSNFATTGTEQNWLLAFSKAGYGGLDLLFKHPDLYTIGAFWDFPGAMTSYSTYEGGASNYGSQTNFAANYEMTSTFLGNHKNPFLNDNRIWINGYGNFQSDVEAFDTAITGQSIVHTTAAEVSRTHSWTSGWVPSALAGLYANSIAAPTISAIGAAPTDNGATITWTTNDNADTQVDFGISSSYSASSTLVTASSTSHSVVLAGLNTGTTYHYRVRSKNFLGNLATSTDQTFTTTGGYSGGIPTYSTFASGTPVVGQVLTVLDSTGKLGFVTLNIPVHYHAQDTSITRTGTGSPMTSSGGLLVASVTFTPKGSTDTILVEGHVHGNSTASQGILASALYNGSATTPIADSFMSINNDTSYSDPYGDTSFSYAFTAGTTAPITLNLRGGDTAGGTFKLNYSSDGFTNEVSSLDVIDIPNN